METGSVLANRYELRELLGQGGMGAVYAGLDRRLSRDVAIKVLREGTADAEALQRFRREAHAAAALGNPHIVHVSDFQENPGEPAFIVMEKIAGTSLRSVVAKDGRMSPQRACKIAAQILFALEASHHAGILHRDIKPENVIVSTTPAGDIVKVVDFGLAGAIDAAKTGAPVVLTSPQLSLTGTGIVGTVGYIAPERLRGMPADARADIYAVGATLYFLLAGKRAFDGMSSTEWAAAALLQVPRLENVAPDTDRALANVVGRAMAIDLEHRYATARQFLAALDPWLDGVVLSTTRRLAPEPGADPRPDTTASSIDFASLPMHPEMPKRGSTKAAEASGAGRLMFWLLLFLTASMFLIGTCKLLSTPRGYKSLGKQTKTNAEKSERELAK